MPPPIMSLVGASVRNVPVTIGAPFTTISPSRTTRIASTMKSASPESPASTQSLCVYLIDIARLGRRRELLVKSLRDDRASEVQHEGDDEEEDAEQEEHAPVRVAVGDLAELRRDGRRD